MIIKALCVCGKCFDSFELLRIHERYCEDARRVTRLRRKQRPTLEPKVVTIRDPRINK